VTLRPTDTGPLAPRPEPIYPPREDSALLLPFARVRARVRLLEIGAGAGLAALAAARRGARVVATDLNPHALRRLRSVALAEGLPIEVVRTDVARGLGRFDRVLANPPYLPTRREERDPDPWQNLALDGGPDGCRLLARIVRSLPEHLAPFGEAYLVVSSLQDARRLTAIRARWLAGGGSWRLVARRSLEGERLDVWKLTLRGSAEPVTTPARRGRGPPPGSGDRRRTPRPRRSGSSPAPARGSTTARGAASGRRRSPRGS
jgi:release factor glutamine methyltransferase